MKNEAAFKKAFKLSVRRYKGFSLSLAAPMISGIPDLFVVMPGFMPVLLEAKWLGEIKREKFSRKMEYTSLQMLWIKECHEVNPYTAMGLAGFIYNNQIHACFVVHGTPQFYQLSNCFLTDCAYSKLSSTTKVFDIPHMFAKVPIPRITRVPHAPDILEQMQNDNDEFRASKSPLAV